MHRQLLDQLRVQLFLMRELRGILPLRRAYPWTEGRREQRLPEQRQSHSPVHHIGKPGLQYTSSTNLDGRPHTGSHRIEPPGLLKDRSNLGDHAMTFSVPQVHQALSPTPLRDNGKRLMQLPIVTPG